MMGLAETLVVFGITEQIPVALVRAAMVDGICCRRQAHDQAALTQGLPG